MIRSEVRIVGAANVKRSRQFVASGVDLLDLIQVRIDDVEAGSVAGEDRLARLAADFDALLRA